GARFIGGAGGLVQSLTLVHPAGARGVSALADDATLGATVLSCPDNPGYGAAANAGVDLRQAPLVLVANADVWVHLGALDELAQALEEAPDAACAGPLLLNTEGSPQDSAFAFPGLGQAVSDLLPLPVRVRGSRLNGRLWSDGPARDVGYVLGAFMLIRRRAYELVGGFSSAYWMYAEEVDLCRRFRDDGWRVRYVPAAHVTHLRAATTSARDIEMLPQLYRSRARWYRRHSARPMAGAAIGLMRLALGVRARLPGPRREAYAAAQAALNLD
ncbi:MAG: glycosyltransferase family 2 protein, partial [Chloroflexota bacterium]|nr:glycosyltransferase family 2 protein [Chloroflexota bacterium]